MSKVVVEIGTDNAAFRQEDGTLDGYEVARLLSVAGQRIIDGHNSGGLMDVNGNAVGTYAVTEG